MQETNLYWDVSGWYIFDIMDREAHEESRKQIWECVTINANINYYKPVTDKNKIHCSCDIVENLWNKCLVYVTLYVSWDVYATASFLFIAKKNPS